MRTIGAGLQCCTHERADLQEQAKLGGANCKDKGTAVAAGGISKDERGNRVSQSAEIHENKRGEWG